MANDVNVHLGLEGAREFQGDWRACSYQVDQFGDVVEDTSRRTGAASRALDQHSDAADKATGKSKALAHVTGELKNMLIGMVGISAAIAMLKSYIDHLEKVNEASQALVETTRGLEQATKSYASQANVLGDPAQVDAARAQIRQLQQAANITDWSRAEGVMTSGHSAIGTAGELLGAGPLGVATAVGQFAQVKELGQGDVDSLFKMISIWSQAQGRELNEATAVDIIAQLSAVQQQSKAVSFSAFAPGAIKALSTGVGFSLSPTDALAQYASALDVVPSGDLAAERTKQVYESLLQPNVVKALAGQAGVSPDAFSRRPFAQQLDALTRWAAASDPADLAAAGVPAEKISTLSLLYTPEQLPRAHFFDRLAETTDPAAYRRGLEGWRLSGPGRVEAEQARTVAEGGKASPEMILGEALFGTGDELWKQYEAQGRNSRLMPDAIEKPLVSVWRPLRDRFENLRDHRQEMAPEMREEIDNLAQELYREVPAYGNPLSQQEAGSFLARIQNLERAAGNQTIIQNQTVYNPISGPAATSTFAEDQR